MAAPHGAPLPHLTDSMASSLFSACPLFSLRVFPSTQPEGLSNPDVTFLPPSLISAPLSHLTLGLAFNTLLNLSLLFPTLPLEGLTLGILCSMAPSYFPHPFTPLSLCICCTPFLLFILYLTNIKGYCSQSLLRHRDIKASKKDKDFPLMKLT